MIQLKLSPVFSLKGCETRLFVIKDYPIHFNQCTKEEISLHAVLMYVRVALKRWQKLGMNAEFLHKLACILELQINSNNMPENISEEYAITKISMFSFLSSKESLCLPIQGITIHTSKHKLGG